MAQRIKPTDFFAKHPLFSFDELVASSKGRPVSTVKALLRYHVERGNLQRLQRGLYARADWYDPWLATSRLTEDAIVAYDSALARHPPWSERPEQRLPERMSFLTGVRSGVRRIWNVVFTAIAPPPRLGKRWATVGVTTQIRSDLPFKLTTLERTNVDLLDHLELASHDDLWITLAINHRTLDYEAMVDHAIALGSGVLGARLGYLLGALPSTPRKQLARLERRRPASPTYFDRARRAGPNGLIARWNLLVPSRLDRLVLRTDFRGRAPSFPKETELPR
jgi:predicted transcriptional regulator of viral defense system